MSRTVNMPLLICAYEYIFVFQHLLQPEDGAKREVSTISGFSSVQSTSIF
jgi:hypothetical protein